MNDYTLIKNKIFEGSLPGQKIVYEDCEINNVTFDKRSDVEKCFFIGCPIRSMKIIKLKDKMEFTFVNCRISDLRIEKSNMPHIEFIGCQIINSNFIDSNLAGIKFSLKLDKPPGSIKPTIIEFIKKSIQELKNKKKKLPEESSVYKTKFLFCDMNDMLIDHTTFSETDIKHCNLKNMKISEKVTMQYVDLRGSKIFKSCLGDCKFQNIRFNKGFFIVYWIDELIWFIPKRLWYFKYSIMWKKRYEIERASKLRIIQEKIFRIRRVIKKIMYSLKIGRLRIDIMADLLSSTDLQQIRYSNSDFLDSYHFFWHIQDLDFIHNLKGKHPFLAGLTFWASNYMRSFGALLTLSFIIIFLFSLIYSSSWIDFVNNSESGTLYLSFKIFSNFGITPLSANNGITKILVTFEIILGYFALGILLSIIVFPFSRRTSLPIKNKNHETTDD